jgi:hypothetical protein
MTVQREAELFVGVHACPSPSSIGRFGVRKKLMASIFTILATMAVTVSLTAGGAAADSVGADALQRFALPAQQAAKLQQQIDDTLRQAPGGVQVSQNEIAWNDGTVVLAFPLPGQEKAPLSSNAVNAQADGHVEGCPYGDLARWYCFYEHSYWGGRRLQFSGCGRYDFDPYGFRDQTSSWVNTKLFTNIYVWNYTGSGSSSSVLWVEPTNSKSASTSADNQADYVLHNCIPGT